MAVGSGISPPTLRAVGAGSWGTFVYSLSRPLALWFTHAMALACDPEPVWVEFREAGSAADPMGPVGSGEVPASRLYVVAKAEAKPHPTVPPPALWKLVRSDEPKETLVELSDFLRLPSQVQEAIGFRGGRGPRRVLVCANTDLIREYYPRTPEGIRPFVLTALRENLIPIFSSIPPNDPGYLALDHIFEVRAKGLDDWRNGTLYCERAPAGSEFVAGQSFPLTSIPEFVSVLERRRF